MPGLLPPHWLHATLCKAAQQWTGVESVVCFRCEDIFKHILNGYKGIISFLDADYVLPDLRSRQVNLKDRSHLPVAGATVVFMASSLIRLRSAS